MKMSRPCRQNERPKAGEEILKNTDRHTVRRIKLRITRSKQVKIENNEEPWAADNSSEQKGLTDDDEATNNSKRQHDLYTWYMVWIKLTKLIVVSFNVFPKIVRIIDFSSSSDVNILSIPSLPQKRHHRFLMTASTFFFYFFTRLLINQTVIWNIHVHQYYIVKLFII